MAHEKDGTDDKPPTPRFIVMAALDHAAYAAINTKGWAAVKKAAKDFADETDSCVVGIWLTSAPDYPLVATVDASNAEKAKGFLKAFATSGHEIHSNVVYKIDTGASAHLAEALCHTKMEGKG